jgi:predicted RNase H-like HicB family nuclease
MELANIKQLLDKYFQGETNLEEENQLKSYFSSENIASELEQYRPLFGYFNLSSKEVFIIELPLKSNKITIAWISIAASILFFGGIFAYMNYKPSSAPVQTVSKLGTFESPEEAFEQTQKALALLSENVNGGVEGIVYLSEFEKSKKLIFKK